MEDVQKKKRKNESYEEGKLIRREKGMRENAESKEY